MGELNYTVSGNIASFRTPSRVPIESLKFHFLPKQEGSGDPSPSNVRPITGWTGLNGRRAGKNLFKFETGRTKQEYLSNGSNLRAIYHTGIVSDGQKICISATPKDPESITNGNINIGYCRNGITYTYSAFITTTGVTNVIAEMSPGDEITLNNTGESIWGLETRNLPRYDIQIEIAKESTEFVEYSGEQIPITFPITGKNIFDVNTYPFTNGIWIHGNNGGISGTENNAYKATVDFIPIERFAGRKITLNKRPGGSNPGFGFYTEESKDSFISGVRNNGATAGTPMTVLVPANAKYMRFSVPADAMDIQIELGEESTSYEPYSSNNTFYGGYVDPVAGEIVAEYEKIYIKHYKSWYRYTNNQFAMNTSKKKSSDKLLCDALPISKTNGFPTTDKSVGLYSNGANYANIVFIKYTDSDNINDFNTWLNSLDGDPCFVYELETPIHIPIPAQDMKAFLDHNNFWSDANDITEVTYAVTESKDILATRKKAMAFDHAHHKKVKWNQLAPAISSPAWYAHSSDIATAQFDNGVATLITIGETDQQYRHALVTRHSSNFWVIGHKYYLRQDVLLDQTGYCICVFGNEWGAQRYVSANVWTTITDAHVTNSTSHNIFGLYPYGSLAIGTVRKIKNVMLFDLTQMFGEGNEPSASQFEHICEINGIDLTTYQPYDEGSDRWLIIP